MIERGRYFNINKNEKHCSICKTGQVDDENHFILKCKRFEQIRLKFYDSVENAPCCKSPGKTLIFGTYGFQHFAIANIDHLFFV
jgi:hypothetical protein